MSTSIVIEGEFIELPNDLVNNPDLISEMLTHSCWKTKLNDTQQKQLEEYLPQSLLPEEKSETLRLLFEKKSLTAFTNDQTGVISGNPIKDLEEKLKNNYFTPELYRVRKHKKKMLKSEAKFLKAKYYNNLLKEVIVSRQCHLAVFTYPKSLKLDRNNITSSSMANKHQEVVKVKETSYKLYRSVLQDVKKRVFEKNSHLTEADLQSSDSDSIENMEISTSNKVHNGVTSKRFRELLIQHKRRRDIGVKTADLDTRGIKLSDVISRTFNGNKKLQGLLSKKKRQSDVSKLSKQNLFKKKKALSKRKKNEMISDFKKCKRINIKSMPGCFFGLVKNVLDISSEKTTDSINQLINDWLTSAEASRCIWTTTRNDWNGLVHSALKFLENPTDISNTEEEVEDFKPLVELNGSVWNWIGCNKTINEQTLLKLCDHWLSKQTLVKTEAMLSRESYLEAFHAQEKRRFQYGHQSFVYTLNGNRYTVPPVKGRVGPIKEGKVAREHSLLTSDRPPQVTLLSLTRDAVARLPNKTGTRTDVCNLIRESQYLAAVVGEAQINSAVSGALDRLHYEHDPCVKYDSAQRMWVNLHADRTVQELEKIHAEQLESPRPKRLKSQVSKRKKNSDDKIMNKKRTSKKKFRDELQDNPTKVERSHIVPSICTTSNVNSSTSTVTTQNSVPKSRNDTFSSSFLTKTENTSITQTVNSPQVAVQSGMISGSGVNAGNTRKIQLTQKQLCDMTRKLSNTSSPAANREFLVGCQGPSSCEDKSCDNHVTARRTIATPSTRPQPSLKLILKPAVGNQRRPTAELVRVVEPNKPAQADVVSKQQVLSSDALRRLSEQLSAVSSRPIKIVQQPIESKLKSAVVKSATGTRVITISNSSQPVPNAVPHSRSSNVINLTMKEGLSGVKSGKLDSMSLVKKHVSDAKPITLASTDAISSQIVYLKRKDLLKADRTPDK